MKHFESKYYGLIFIEVEYIEISSAVCQGVWIARLVKEVMGLDIEAVKIMVDNQSTFMLGKTFTYLKRTKHIDTYYYFT